MALTSLLVLLVLSELLGPSTNDDAIDSFSNEISNFVIVLVVCTLTENHHVQPLYNTSFLVYNSGMCPQWSAVVGPDHHSDKIATTQIKEPPLQTH